MVHRFRIDIQNIVFMGSHGSGASSPSGALMANTLDPKDTPSKAPATGRAFSKAAKGKSAEKTSATLTSTVQQPIPHPVAGPSSLPSHYPTQPISGSPTPHHPFAPNLPTNAVQQATLQSLFASPPIAGQPFALTPTTPSAGPQDHAAFSHQQPVSYSTHSHVQLYNQSAPSPLAMHPSSELPPRARVTRASASSSGASTQKRSLLSTSTTASSSTEHLPIIGAGAQKRPLPQASTSTAGSTEHPSKQIRVE